MSQPNPTHQYKLLLLLPFPPRLDAVQGGSRVIAQLVMQLARRHRVALLCLRGGDEPPIDCSVAGVCEWVETIARQDYGATVWGRWLRRLKFVAGMFMGRPMWVVEWDVAAFREELAYRARSWQPDIVQAEFHIMAQYLPALSEMAAPHVLTIHEPGMRSAPYLLGIYPNLGRIVHRLDASAWRRYERGILCHVQHVVVFSQEDRQALASYGRSVPLTVVQPGTELPPAPLNPFGKAGPSVLFVGNFIHPPNVDAALWLAHDIYPLVLDRVPGCELYIVGKSPPKVLRQTAHDQVIVTGYVPDITPYLDQAAVVVAPLRLGGGMRVKVLDALAAGKALVASPIAVQGLSVCHDQQVLIADSDEQIANAIVDLLLDSPRRARLASQARAWAEDHLSWENAVKCYEDIYARLIHSPYARERLHAGRKFDSDTLKS